MIISSKTKLNAVIGWPLSHSLSPALHNAIYQKNDIDAVMLALPHRDINFLVKAIRHLPIHLTAVTMPHKQSVMKYLDRIDKTARIIGAVNLVINRNGKIDGYNTDVAGIERAFKDKKIKGKNVLILGAGGAARAAAYFVKSRGGKLFCFNRTFRKAEKLVKEFRGKVWLARDFKKINSEIDVIINATPVGMKGVYPDCFFSVNLLNNRQIVFDMVYNPLETKFLKSARQAGATIISGLEMFVGQALEQVRLWLGQKIADNNYLDFLKNVIGKSNEY